MNSRVFAMHQVTTIEEDEYDIRTFRLRDRKRRL
jgi:hypothetical protein